MGFNSAFKGLMLKTWWLPSVGLRTRCKGYSRKWSSSKLLQRTCKNSELYYTFKVLYWQRLHVQCITVIFLCAHFIRSINFHFLILHFPRFTLTLNDTLRNIKPRFDCISSKSGVTKRAHMGANCAHKPFAMHPWCYKKTYLPVLSNKKIRRLLLAAF